MMRVDLKVGFNPVRDNHAKSETMSGGYWFARMWLFSFLLIISSSFLILKCSATTIADEGISFSNNWFDLSTDCNFILFRHGSLIYYGEQKNVPLVAKYFAVSL